MKSNFGKQLSKKEMKNIQGGKYPGCAAYDQPGVAYSQGCCPGLMACGGPKGLLCLTIAECS